MLRFAPSPTKDMDISDLRVALFNYIVAKQLDEELLIRIEDSDKKKNIEGKDREILELLSLFSIEHRPAVYQSENIKKYHQMAMALLMGKKAFSCFCSDERLELQRQKAKDEGKLYRYDGCCEELPNNAVIDNEAPFTVRIKKANDTIKFNDALKGEFDYDPFDVDSFILLKKDKIPTYNFACAVDDMLYDISTVIRDEEYISDTPKQIHIRQALGYDKEINYIHLPMIINANTGKKINKNDNESSVKWLIDEGFLPSAIANYLVSIGNDTPKEIFTVEEAIEWFDVSRLSKSAAEFDIEKLRAINKEHLKSMDEMRLSKILGFADTDIGKLAKIYLEEASTIKEIKEKIDAIFSKKDTPEEFLKEFGKIKECLIDAPYFDDFNELKKYITRQTGAEDKGLLKPLRYILTGTDLGPDLSDIYPYIKNYLGEIIK